MFGKVWLLLALLAAMSSTSLGFSLGTGEPDNATAVVLDETQRVHFRMNAEDSSKFWITHLVDRHADESSYKYYNNGTNAYVLTKPGQPLHLSMDFKNRSSLFSVNPIDFRFQHEANRTHLLEMTILSNLVFESGSLNATNNTTAKIESEEQNDGQRFRIRFEYPLNLVFNMTLPDNSTKKIELKFTDDFSAYPYRLSFGFNSTKSLVLLPNIEYFSKVFLMNDLAKVVEVSPNQVVLASPRKFEAAHIITRCSSVARRMACEETFVCYNDCSVKDYMISNATATGLPKGSVAEMSFNVQTNHAETSAKIVVWIGALIIGIGLGVIFGCRKL